MWPLSLLWQAGLFWAVLPVIPADLVPDMTIYKLERIPTPEGVQGIEADAIAISMSVLANGPLEETVGSTGCHRYTVRDEAGIEYDLVFDESDAIRPAVKGA